MMRFKIDENLHADAADLLRQHGHDAMTVHEQGLHGSSDADIANVCRDEGRVVMTLDLDFSDVRRYPPEVYQGLIVLRLNDQSRSSVLSIIGRSFHYSTWNRWSAIFGSSKKLAYGFVKARPEIPDQLIAGTSDQIKYMMVGLSAVLAKRPG